MIQLQEEYQKKDSVCAKEIISFTSECEALREENKSLTDLLAQRTVLYAAQERRFFNDQRMWGTIRTKSEEEIIKLRSKVQHLEEQLSKVASFTHSSNVTSRSNKRNSNTS